jgi:WD40 repeat protein
VTALDGLRLLPGEPFAFAGESIFTSGGPGEVMQTKAGGKPQLFGRAGSQQMGELAAASDGSLIAAVSETEGFVYFFREDGSLLFDGGVFGGIRPRIAFAADRRTLFSAGYLDLTVRALDCATTATLQQSINVEKSVWSVGFCPRGRLLAWGDDSGSIGLLDANAGSRVRTWTAPYGRVKTVACRSDSEIVALHEDSRLRSFDPRDGHLLRVWDIAEPVQAFVATPSRLLVAVDKAVYSISADGLLSRVFDSELDQVQCLAVDLPRDRIAVGSSGAGYVEVRQLSTGRPLARKFRAHTGLVMALTFLPWNGNLVTAGTLGGTEFTPVSIWSAKGARLTGVAAHPTITTVLATEPHGHLLLTGGSDGHVGLWDENLVGVGRRLASHSNLATSIAVASSALVATAGGDGLIQIHNLDDEILIARARLRAPPR